MNEWYIRTEILNVTHRWPLIVLFILAGYLIGWAVAVILPAPHRAESSLHVSYNGDIHARNIDDFKNWQMGEMNIFIYNNKVLEETLTKLREQDPYWNTVTKEELRSSLNVYWRNVGEWRLVAEARGQQRAEQIVETWKQVTLEQVSLALSHARSTLELDTQIQEISRTRVDVKQRAAELRQIKEGLQSWKTSLDQDRKGKALTPLERWHLASQVARIVTWDPLGDILLEQIPPIESLASEYLPWIDRALVLLDREQHTLDDQSAQLASDYAVLYQAWSNELAASHGLTAYVAVESLDPVVYERAKPVRSTALIAFVGGMLGLLIWALIWLAGPVRRARASIS